MKSADLYRVMRKHLSPALKAAGFTSEKGGSFYWVLPFGERFLRFQIVGNKYGWSEPFGGEFCLSLAIVPSPVKMCMEEINRDDRFDVLDFIDEDGLRRFREIRNEVIDKGLQRRPEGLLALMGSAAERESKQLEREEFPLPFATVWFPWLDELDLKAWAEYLSPRIPRLAEDLTLLSGLSAAKRQSICVQRWKSVDTRTPEQKAEHRGLKSAAGASSRQALNEVGTALSQSRKVGEIR